MEMAIQIQDFYAVYLSSLLRIIMEAMRVALIMGIIKLIIKLNRNCVFLFVEVSIYIY